MNKRKRLYLVGAQFIGAPQIYRPRARRCTSQADKSAMGSINRPLQYDRFWSLKFIIGDGLDQSAPTHDEITRL